MNNRRRATLLATVLVGGCSDADEAVRLHRLNRAEYSNSLRDLLEVDIDVAGDFPDDPPSFGFDNNADVLELTPMTFELHALAVERAVAAALDRSTARRFCPDEASAPACARTLVESFAPQAWRRPLEDAERESLLLLIESQIREGDDVDASARLLLETVLTSPNFLFRSEQLAAGDDFEPLDDYELAARLSYFLWSSTPDEELLAAADAGALTGDGLEAAARRMLDDPRARALTENFAGQWLAFRDIDDVFKDAARFPDFDEELRASMREEARLFFADFVARDRDLRELLTTTETFVDARLAAHYGLPVEVDGFTRVDLEGTARRGVLTQAGLLSVLAYPFTTSPARRGSWIFDRLLCEPLPPPPEGVDSPFSAAAGSTKRDELRRNREDPACAACHEDLDPLGLALERFDAIGQYREVENALPIDPAGTLPSGEVFADAGELAELIAEDPAFIECAVRQALVYALGRGLAERDADVVERIADTLARRGFRTRELFVLIATSERFRGRARGAA